MWWVVYLCVAFGHQTPYEPGSDNRPAGGSAKYLNRNLICLCVVVPVSGAMAGAAMGMHALICVCSVRHVPILLAFGTGLGSSVARGGQFAAFRRSGADSSHFTVSEVNRADIRAHHWGEKRALELTRVVSAMFHVKRVVFDYHFGRFSSCWCPFPGAPNGITSSQSGSSASQDAVYAAN